jgi:hypothetical protein
MLTGTLDDFDLRHVFRFVSLSRKTGKLSVAGGEGTGRVFFRAGEIYHAESDLRRQGFGRKLVNAGKLSEVDLRATLERCAATGKSLGEALVADGLVARDDLELVLREEIEEVALGLFRSNAGRFTFELDEQVESDTLIVVPVETLLTEDADVPTSKVPSLVPVAPAASSGNDVQISISADEWAVIALIDGRRTVGDIAVRLQQGELSVMRSLRRLLAVGLVRLGDIAEDAGRTLPGRDRGGEPSSADALATSAAAPPPPPRRTPPPPPPPPPEAAPEVVDLSDESVWSHGVR